jgi:shikimate dehydrogenase
MEIKGSTRVALVIGHPVAHSQSPIMHNSAFRRLKLDNCYIALDIAPEGLGDFIKSLRFTNIIGVNVTIPYKERVIEYLDELSEEASILKAVNTIKITDQKLIGYNTDVLGFEKCLEGIDISKSSAFIIGAGGAAKAVAYTFCKLNISRVYVTNRTEEKAQKLVEFIEDTFNREVYLVPFDNLDIPEPPDIIVNTTPLGMEGVGGNIDIPPYIIKKGSTVIDLVYNPPKTKFLEVAESLGANIQNGRKMLVYQGAASFKIWTGIDSPIDVMEGSIKEYL